MQPTMSNVSIMAFIVLKSSVGTNAVVSGVKLYSLRLGIHIGPIMLKHDVVIHKTGSTKHHKAATATYNIIVIIVWLVLKWICSFTRATSMQKARSWKHFS